MGLLAQPRLRAGGTIRDRRGLALPASLLGVVAIGLLSAGAWIIVDLNARSANNRELSGRALQTAEAGAAHAVALLETRLDDRTLTRLLVGSDSIPGTSDDGLLTGYTIPQDERIPAEGFAWGEGSYTVVLLDDPKEGDGDPKRDRNGRILVRCAGQLGDGSSATVDIIYGTEPMAPAIVVDGPVELGGSVELRGSCGGVYANGPVDVTGTLVVEQAVISSDTVSVRGSIVDPSGSTVPPLVDQASITVPQYDLWDTCDGADYILQDDGWILETSTGTLSRGTGQGAFGWRQGRSNPVEWRLDANDAIEGTFCVKGNAEISGNLGSGGGDRFRISIFATGGISVSGTPTIQADHPEGYLLMAQGDLEIGGNPAGGDVENYGGTLYAGSQCEVSGNPGLSGQLFCADEPDPAGAIDYADENHIHGNVRFTHTCPPPESVERYAIAWFQRYGE